MEKNIISCFSSSQFSSVKRFEMRITLSVSFQKIFGFLSELKKNIRFLQVTCRWNEVCSVSCSVDVFDWIEDFCDQLVKYSILTGSDDAGQSSYFGIRLPLVIDITGFSFKVLADSITEEVLKEKSIQFAFSRALRVLIVT